MSCLAHLDVTSEVGLTPGVWKLGSDRHPAVLTCEDESPLASKTDLHPRCLLIYKLGGSNQQQVPGLD